MNHSYLLDTNILVAYQNNDETVTAYIENNSVLTSSIVIGELYFGAYKSERVELNIARVDQTRLLIPVLACDENTGKVFGEIKNQLRRAGRPIPENDIWIAATAIQHSLVLATRDAHFKAVDGLQLEIW